MTITSQGWRNIIFSALGAAAVIAIFLVIRSCNAPKPDVIAIADSTQYFKNKFGQEVAALKQREDDFYRVTSGKFLDSIAKLHNTKDRLLQEVITLRQKGTVTIPTTSPPIIKTDTVPGECPRVTSAKQDFVNPYYKAGVFISLTDTPSTLTLQTLDTLSVVVKTEKEGGLFNRKTYLQVDATNANPYNHIANLQVYRQPLPKQKKIGIGIFAGYGFGGTSFKPSIVIGVGASYNIIRF